VELEELRSCGYFVAGTTDRALKSRTDLYDLFVDGEAPTVCTDGVASISPSLRQHSRYCGGCRVLVRVLLRAAAVSERSLVVADHAKGTSDAVG
jgi:hypothetical protein